jgi:hypothetical protein
MRGEVAAITRCELVAHYETGDAADGRAKVPEAGHLTLTPGRDLRGKTIKLAGDLSPLS